MRRRIAPALLCFLVLCGLISCEKAQQTPLLQQDAYLISQGVQNVWSRFDMGNIFCVNAEDKVHIPPPLQDLVISPSTTFDYLYVRVWEGRERRQLVRYYLAHFVIRDLNSGALLRGTIENGVMTFEPLPEKHWALIF